MLLKYVLVGVFWDILTDAVSMLRLMSGVTVFVSVSGTVLEVNGSAFKTFKAVCGTFV